MVGVEKRWVQAPGGREGETFRERKRVMVSCAECGVTVEASSLKQHMEIQHVDSVPHTSEVDVWGGKPTTYVVPFHRVLKMLKCPVTGCLAVAHSAGRLRDHFIY